jgi:hypothetical protein
VRFSSVVDPDSIGPLDPDSDGKNDPTHNNKKLYVLTFFSFEG